MKLALYFCAMIALHVRCAAGRPGIPFRMGLPDFSGAYTAGRILRDGQGGQLYDDDLQESMQRSFLPQCAQRQRRTILPSYHLPYEALLYTPLAHFSYLTAYGIWLGVNLAFIGLDSISAAEAA